MFFMAAIAGVALASCAKNEVETPEQDIITFAEPVTAVQTKAVEIVGNYPESQNFSVFAHYYVDKYTSFDDNFIYMKNVETAYSTAVEGWDSKAAGGVNYYWPKQGTLTFAAYSPTDAEGDMESLKYTANGFKFTNFSVLADANEQYDLLFSERAYNQTKSTMNTSANPYKGVELQFNHALSSIVFYAKSDINYQADNFKITINKIDLKGIYSTGSFNQNLVDTDQAKTSETWVGWTGQKNAIDYTAFTGDLDLTVDNTLVSVVDDDDDTTTITPGENDKQNSHLILLPQGLSNAKLYIEYTITNSNVNPVLAITQNATLDLATSNVDNWFRGKRYNYHLTFGLDKIYFDPVVTNWDNKYAGSFTVGSSQEKTN